MTHPPLEGLCDRMPLDRRDAKERGAREAPQGTSRAGLASGSHLIPSAIRGPITGAPDHVQSSIYFLTRTFLLLNSARALMALEFPIRLLVLMRPKAFRL